MKSNVISFFLTTVITTGVLAGCSNNSANESTTDQSSAISESSEGTDSNTNNTNSADNSASGNTGTDADASANDASLSASFDEFIASLHAGQSYAYAPICDGEDALLVTSYTFDDLNGHIATYDASIYIEEGGCVKKVTTVQSGGTAYPIAVTADNELIVGNRNSVQVAHIDKASGKYVITRESDVEFTTDEEGTYHDYIEGEDVSIGTDSTLYDELDSLYWDSEVISFESAGIASDNTPNLEGAVYAAYEGDDLYNISCYIGFESDTTGFMQTPDGLSGAPFDYELKGSDIVFHIASADDNTAASFSFDNASFPVLTFTGESPFENPEVTLTFLDNADPETFEASTYYERDNTLLMQVSSYDKTSLTGDLYREEKIKEEFVDGAVEGDILSSVNGTAFTVVSFEEVNKELEYGTDDEFKQDVVGTTRFDKFLVRSSDDDFYYALQKEDYETSYKVVSLMTEGTVKKLIAKDVTFSIKEDCVIVLLKFVLNDESGELKEDYIIGREFDPESYPGWSEDATEYYLSSDMLVSISVVDNELSCIVQQYVE